MQPEEGEDLGVLDEEGDVEVTALDYGCWADVTDSGGGLALRGGGGGICWSLRRGREAGRGRGQARAAASACFVACLLLAPCAL